MRLVRVLFHVTAVLALGVLTGLEGPDPATAQPPSLHNACGSSSCTVGKVFSEPDLAELWTDNPDLAETAKWIADKLKQPDPASSDPGCYPPKSFSGTISQTLQDKPELSPLISQGRIDAVNGYLKGKGITGEPISWTTPPPAKGQEDGELQVTYRTDRDSPILSVTSVPGKGTLVKKNEKIVVTLTASERNDAGHKSWPSGVRSIQLRADGLVVEPTGQYSPQPCKPQTLKVTYTVPADPPPVIHLEALAEDAVGNPPSTKEADFPTSGDWYGVLTGHANFSIYNDTTEVRFTFSEASDGTITGRGHAKTTSEKKLFSGGECEILRKGPSDYDFALTGTHIGDKFNFELPDKAVEIVISSHCTYPNGKVEDKSGVGRNSIFLGFGAGGSKFLSPKVLAQDGATETLGPSGGVSGKIEIHRVKKN